MNFLLVILAVILLCLYGAGVMRLAFYVNDLLGGNWLGGTAYFVIAMTGIVGIPIGLVVQIGAK